MTSSRRAAGTWSSASTGARSRSASRPRRSPRRSSRLRTAGRSSGCLPTTVAWRCSRPITTTFPRRPTMPHELMPLPMGGPWHAITDPWSQEILRRAFLEVSLIGAVAGPLGCGIVFYGLSYSAESLAHGLLPGLVIAALIGAPLVLGAGAGLLVAALAIAAAARVPAIGRDTSVAVVVTTLFGLGVLLALSPASPPGIQELLFGDVLGVSD